MKTSVDKTSIYLETSVLPEMEDNHFLEKVQQKIVEILKERATSFSVLLSLMENCDPIVLSKALDQLKTRGNLTEHSKYYSLNTEVNDIDHKVLTPLDTISSATFLHQQEVTYNWPSNQFINLLKSTLPEAAPVYSQWWFHNESYPKLSNAILTRAPKQSKIAFIGASTLGAYFSKATNYTTSIFDIDSSLLKALKQFVSNTADLIQYDVFKEIQPGHENAYDLVYLDPPWYVDTMMLFIKRAAEMAKKSGLIFISFPPLKTRETTIKERENLFKYIYTYGLKTMAFWPSGVNYDIPQFESKAYRNSGIHLDEPWRTGDLYLIQKIHEIPKDTPDHMKEDKQDQWEEVMVNRCRFFFRKNGHRLNRNGLLISKPTDYRDYRLKTTSQREKGWDEANLITSRNNCAIVSGKNIIFDILQEINTNSNLDTARQNILSKHSNTPIDVDIIHKTINIIYQFTQE